MTNNTACGQLPYVLAPDFHLHHAVQVNIVNADLLAKKRGLRVVETVVPSDGTAILSHMEVSVGPSRSKFSSAVDPSSGKIRCTQHRARGAPRWALTTCLPMQLCAAWLGR